MPVVDNVHGQCVHCGAGHRVPAVQCNDAILRHMQQQRDVRQLPTRLRTERSPDRMPGHIKYEQMSHLPFV
jgi:predicted fused transcriptional regulator/phosphomethylpyrimidine kinase